MNQNSKRQPEPLDRNQEIRAGLERLTKGEQADEVSIAMRVAGGAPGQRYHLNFASRGLEVLDCNIDCDLSDRHHQMKADAGERAHTRDLAKRLIASGVLEAETDHTMFLPDTVVGVLEITVGDVVRTIYFAADPDQAAVQDAFPPEQVERAADAVYTAAESLLKIKNARP